MEAKLPYGQNALLNLQLPEEKLLAWYGCNPGEPLDDIGAAMAAEIGTMRVTEQIDALKVMGKNPMHYLVAPKIASVVIMLPLLVSLGNAVGFLGGFIIIISTGKINPYSYINAAQIMLSNYDIICSLIKATCFGLIISCISSYYGLNCKEGATSVGKNTTKAVVTSLLCIFIGNFFLSSLLF